MLAWLSMLTWSRAADRRRKRRPEVDIASVHPKHGIDAYTSCDGEQDAADIEAFVDGHRVRAALSQVPLMAPRGALLLIRSQPLGSYLGAH